MAALNAEALTATRALLRAAEAERMAAEWDRHRQRLERVGELAEELFWTAATAQQAGWMSARNRLRPALVGLHGELPKGQEALNASTHETAMGAGRQLADDVEAVLTRLEAARAAATAAATQASPDPNDPEPT